MRRTGDGQRIILNDNGVYDDGMRVTSFEFENPATYQRYRAEALHDDVLGLRGDEENEWSITEIDPEPDALSADIEELWTDLVNGGGDTDADTEPDAETPGSGARRRRLAEQGGPPANRQRTVQPVDDIVDVTGLSFSPNELKVTGDNGYDAIRASRHNAEMKAAHGNGTEGDDTGIGTANVRVSGWEHTGIIPMPAEYAVENMHVFIEETGAPETADRSDVWGFLAAAEYFREKLRDACEAMQAAVTTPTEERGEPPGRRLTRADRETHNVILGDMGAATPSGSGSPARPAPRASRAMRLRPPRGAAMRTALFVIGLAGVVFGLGDSRIDVVGSKTQGGELRGDLKIGPCARVHGEWTPTVKCSRGGERVMDASSLVIDTAGMPVSASPLTIAASGAWEVVIESDPGFVGTVMQSPANHPRRHVVKRGAENAVGITSLIEECDPLTDGNVRGGESFSPMMFPRWENHEGPGSTTTGDLGLRIDGSQNRGAEKSQESSTSDMFLRYGSKAIEDDGSSGGSPDV
jgi:hypothetical protein